MQGQTIAIDATAALDQGGGIGRYVRELLAALAQIDAETSYRLFVAGQRQDRLPAAPGPNFTWHPSPLNAEWHARLWQRARLPIPIQAWTGPAKLLHAPDFSLPPVRRGTRTILTVHDLAFLKAPESAVPGLRAYLSRVVPRSVARADLVLCDSDSTRQDLIEVYGTEPGKVRVLYSGVNARFRPIGDPERMEALRARYGIAPGPFILSVGTVQPRKNYARLAEALSGLPGDIRLLIIGGPGWLEDDLYRQVSRLRLGKRIQFLGFVQDEDLPAFYNAASVVAIPSLYEGFGLPVLEAMACGVPVITSNRSSLPEVGGDAALLVNPEDTGEIRAALGRAIDDRALRQDMIRRGLAQASQFTWEKAAQQLLGHYRDLME